MPATEKHNTASYCCITLKELVHETLQPPGKQNCVIISRLYYCLIVPLWHICSRVVIYHSHLNIFVISSRNNDMPAVETSRVIVLKLLESFTVIFLGTVLSEDRTDQ
jgi:hypothetical protein